MGRKGKFSFNHDIPMDGVVDGIQNKTFQLDDDSVVVKNGGNR